jgi:biopolymer transport protein TolR
MPKLEETQQPPGRRARRARSMHVASSLAEINVVPLVDVMLVLLVIFMVTAPMMQQGYPIKLPESRRSAPANAPVKVVVPLSFRVDTKVLLGDEAIRLEVLNVRIGQALENQLAKRVIVAGDGGITMQELMRVLDKLKEGGVQDAAIQTQPPGVRRP